MMRLGVKLTLIGFTIAGIFLLAGVAEAGQRRQRGAAEPQVDEKTAKMTVEELRAYQAYYYASGGKDPLSMRIPTAEELGLSGDKEITAITLEQMEKEMEEALASIVAEIKNHRYANAIKVGDDIIYKIDNDWPPIKADQLVLRQLDEEIRNYHRMAVRLKNQEDIRIEFESLHLRVDGVIWSPSDAKAVVNGTLLAAGEVMLKERKQGDLRIEMIEEHGVVFQFKGMRFRLPVEIYAPAAQPTQRK